MTQGLQRLHAHSHLRVRSRRISKQEVCWGYRVQRAAEASHSLYKDLHLVMTRKRYLKFRMLKVPCVGHPFTREWSQTREEMFRWLLWVAKTTNHLLPETRSFQLPNKLAHQDSHSKRPKFLHPSTALTRYSSMRKSLLKKERKKLFCVPRGAKQRWGARKSQCKATSWMGTQETVRSAWRQCTQGSWQTLEKKNC